jgi:hypothetical protein
LIVLFQAWRKVLVVTVNSWKHKVDWDERRAAVELESGEGIPKIWTVGLIWGVKALADPLRALGGERPRAFNTGEG